MTKTISERECAELSVNGRVLAVVFHNEEGEIVVVANSAENVEIGVTPRVK